MAERRTLDPVFASAVAAIDRGDVAALEAAIAAHPDLLACRADYGDGYFSHPYLLWFVAENPIRNGTLPRTIGAVTRVLVDALRRNRVGTFREQVDYALELVGSGRVPRECGVQRELMDVLIDAGASPDCLAAVVAHRERDAAERLLERGARLTLPAAAAVRSVDDVARLIPESTARERQAALIGAAINGRSDTIPALIRAGVDLDAFGPEGFHPHATALHQAVYSGSLDTVRALVSAGADLRVRDRIYQGTPLGWAKHLERKEIAEYLRACGAVDEPAPG